MKPDPEETLKKQEEKSTGARSAKEQCSLLIDAAMELRFSEPLSSIEKAEQALRISEEIDFEVGKARSCFCMGLAHFNLSDYEQSFVWLHRSQLHFEKAGDTWGISNALNNIGLIHLRLGDFTRALENFSSSLQIKKEAHDNYGTANVLISMASIQREAGNLPEAESMLEQSLEIATEIKSDLLVAKVLSEQGMILNLQQKSGAAEQKILEAKTFFEKKKNMLGISHCMLRIGKIRAADGRDDDAMEFFEEGRNMAEQVGDKSLQAIFLCEMAGEKIKIYKSAAAVTLLEEAQGIGERLQEKPLLKNIACLLSEAFESAGDWRRALQAYKKFNALNEEISSVEIITRLRNQQISARVTVLEQEKKLLALENLAAIEAVRARISRDMHDEIGSGLTKISLMNERLKLKFGDFQKQNEPLFDKIQASSKDIISNLSELVWSINPHHDNLGGMLSYFRNYIAQFLEETPLQYSIDFPDFTPHAENNDGKIDDGNSATSFQIPIHPDLRRNLFLVLKESLNNILKHAGATSVQVDFVLNKNHFRFTVADNGKGLEEGKEHAFGNGLINMKHRIAQVNGRMEMISAPDEGMKIIIDGQL
jgi:signal transduction histidine kinase